jgi:REP element-mobilizing transposase RayT
MDRLLDEARTGPRYLAMPEIAGLVVDAIQYRSQAGMYELHSYSVMPNHVHLLVTPAVPVSQLMQSLKRHTAREANLVLGLTGRPFWQDECFDRLVRGQEEFQRIARYIEWNPVRAGLVTAPDDFDWSSAGPSTTRPQAASLPHML